MRLRLISNCAPGCRAKPTFARLQIQRRQACAISLPSGNIALLFAEHKMSYTKRVRTSECVRAGVDTGGTFTDFFFEAGGEPRIFKLASTPDDPSRAIIEGLKRIAAETGSSLTEIEVVHGTTVGTNALLQRRGARIALVTTAGFEDVIEIGRQARPELYNLNAVKPAPLVASDLRLGVHERVAASGEVLESLHEDEVKELLEKLRQVGCESVAISLLFSFAYPRHEQRIAKALTTLGVPLSISHQILPEYREYERTSTVTVNAYLQPLMGRYLRRLSENVATEPKRGSIRKSSKIKTQSPKISFRVMQSSGGSISAAAAAN